MKRIPLSQGQVALIDDKDYALVSRHTWCAGKWKHGFNAMTTIRVNGVQHTKRMHQIIMNPPKGMVVDHINHNTLDNRRANLRVCTKQQNRFNSKPVKEHKGISLQNTDGRNSYWRVRFTINGKKIDGGLFKKKEDAIQTAERLYKEYHGDFAYQIEK